MAKLTPDLDKLSSNLNKTVPSVTGNLPPKLKQANITSAIGDSKNEICNKVSGVVAVATGIAAGAIAVFEGTKALLTGKANLSDLISGAVDSVIDNNLGKLNDVKKSFNNTFDKIKNGELNLANAAKNQIDQLEKELTEKFESVKIASSGFKDTLTDVKNITNNTIKNITNDASALASFESGLCSKAETDLINTAVNQKSVSDILKNQDKIIENSSKLIDYDKKNDDLYKAVGLKKPKKLTVSKEEEYELLENAKQLKEIGVSQIEIDKFYNENNSSDDGIIPNMEWDASGTVPDFKEEDFLV